MRAAAGGSCDRPMASVLEQLAVGSGSRTTAVLYYQGNFPLSVVPFELVLRWFFMVFYCMVR
jgi:hypothetical protein